MSTKKQNIENLIRYELVTYKKITTKAMMLYVENRISGNRFKELCNECL